MGTDDCRLDFKSVMPKDLAAVATLAAGGTIVQAAAAANTTRQRVGRLWKTEPWQRAVREIRDGTVRQVAGLLAEAARAAADRLGWLVNNADSHQVQAKAAKDILELSLKYRDHSDILDRLQALESRAEAVARQETDPVGDTGTTESDK